MWLNGQIKDVSTMTETFVTERLHVKTQQVQLVRIAHANGWLRSDWHSSSNLESFDYEADNSTLRYLWS